MAQHMERNPITVSIDILFTLTIFWALVEWQDAGTLEAKILFVFLYLIIINDWFSCRATYEFYTPEMFLIDVAIIFLFLRMMDALTNAVSVAGYNIIFWLLMTGLSVLYGVWDYVVSFYTEDRGRKKGLRSWAHKMFLTSILCALSYGGLYWLIDNYDSRVGLFLIAEVPSFLIFVALIILWNKEKFQLYKELERRIKVRRSKE